MQVRGNLKIEKNSTTRILFIGKKEFKHRTYHIQQQRKIHEDIYSIGESVILQKFVHSRRIFLQFARKNGSYFVCSISCGERKKVGEIDLFLGQNGENEKTLSCLFFFRL